MVRYLLSLLGAYVRGCVCNAVLIGCVRHPYTDDCVGLSLFRSLCTERVLSVVVARACG